MKRSDKNAVLDKARADIEKAIEQDGPYSHNICSLVLAAVYDKLGRKAANKLVDEFDLDTIFDIQKAAQ